jgi:hypothetical protein
VPRLRRQTGRSRKNTRQGKRKNPPQNLHARSVAGGEEASADSTT